MCSGYLDKLLNENARLSGMVYSRAAFVQFELDRLRRLRAELALVPAQNRKTRRIPEQRFHSSPPVDLRSPIEEFNPALIAALQAEVQAHRGTLTLLTRCSKRDWEQIAASLRRAGHRSCTPYELLTLFKNLRSTSAAFSTAEVQMLCQLVREKGYDWPSVCEALRQRFGQERHPFELAHQYRSCMRRAFVQNHLSSSQLAKLLDSESINFQHRDYDQLCVEANRFATNKALQVDPRYLQKEMEVLAFSRYIPARYHLFWKMMNLMSHLPLPPQHRLDAFHHKMPLCYQQLSLDDLSRRLECTVEELRRKVTEYLLTLSRSPETLNFEECSKKLFGNSSAARAIYRIAEELHERES
ncbi:hypothetical protein ABL78_7794 [Leptomonas seymouri]|uniref:Uncharacterized protein n=1 Tax=Leptomonas seymouri TaxID=5684 RepID=A0A0N1HRX1_LEPSE|nr:hypothetical protein ABL78_7794 [Leptomonas seymouri]|eukprot:KPI83181.1 hypothetical protein ABL78_7794 [Leptomonas seymouri]